LILINKYFITVLLSTPCLWDMTPQCPRTIHSSWWI